jgi:hypothetical protein
VQHYFILRVVQASPELSQNFACVCVEVLSGGFVCQGGYVLPIVALHRMGNYTRCTQIITLVDVRYVNMLDVLICQNKILIP